MPPRHQTLPPAQTSSAREALMSFYCQLCSKGYSRMNDYEAHLSSYDHSHNQRRKDMKAMVKDPNAVARARKQEQKAEGGGIIFKLPDSSAGGTATASGGGGGGGGFKKGGFKKTSFVSVAAAAADAEEAAKQKNAEQEEQLSKATGLYAANDENPTKKMTGAAATAPRSELVESDTDDEGYEMYDPRKPTD
ncbi:hypothetical protein B0H66DRAFT_598775 [Apodospora peruviana]|uniref:C2H2-type domain-containing protein n=1 Tax=Apodospora peruviana TaxID=516989 RepID=A0AAE0IUD1_9PEZI|nr:hypothetical protein B0H66DRAFT_598775 [Apodospora peruviana]